MQHCELSTKRIKRADDPLFLQAMSLYETSFPDAERRSVAQNEDLLCDPRFSMLAFCVRGEFAAMAGVWDVDGMLYIEHLCTVPRLRGQGIGAAVLQMLKDEQKTVMLEIEPPVDELTRRRKAFYERCGFGYDPAPALSRRAKRAYSQRHGVPLPARQRYDKKARRLYRKNGHDCALTRKGIKIPPRHPLGGFCFVCQNLRLFSPKDLILPPPVRLKLRLYS